MQVKGDMMFPVPLPPVKSWKLKKHIIYSMQVDFGLNIYHCEFPNQHFDFQPSY